MSLTDELKNKADASKEKQSSEVKSAMENDIKQIVVNPIAVGEVIPEIILTNHLGEEVNVNDIDKPMIITFYRGGWCPYCNLELAAYKRAMPDIEDLGATLVAISPETPDNSLSTAQKNDIEFTVLSDIDNKVAKEFGIVHELTDDLVDVYKGFGVDLEASQKNNNNELPLPATFIVDKNCVIVYSFVNTDYKKRLDPKDAIEILKDNIS